MHNEERRRQLFLVALLLSASGCSQVDWARAHRTRVAAYRERASQDWRACARDFAEVGRMVRPGSESLVSAAGCWAHLGETDVALDVLKEAMALGFHDPPALEADDDLATLRHTEHWGVLLEKARANQNEYEARTNQELRALEREDQADRVEPIDWSVVTPRDDARRARVSELLGTSSLKTSEDFMNAAVVLNHGDSVTDIDRAHLAALKAVELEPSRALARMLAGATEDRALMMRKRPQRYGTQLHRELNHFELYIVDPAVTDAQRSEWFLPSLNQVRKNLELMNHPGE